MTAWQIAPEVSSAERSPATLYLICGMIGAGKTTLAKQLAEKLGAVRFCPDEWLLRLMKDVDDRDELDRMRGPVEEIQLSTAEALLARGVDAILENGFWVRAERHDYCKRVRNIGGRVVLHYLEVERDELWRRIEARNVRTEAGSLRISEQELDYWLTRFEPPDEAELEIYDGFEIHGSALAG